ncbi:MAG: 4-hydroxy-tetrahydrodipicolinate reductase [Thermoguttaceae bacterium]|nr:4-hydroxy-tetrahydrodipicolinate reductase [Thermoguttaceae bacterium]MDW8039738.1 4-hydroxy-tetrahydrodipicolinate reductase [Thermoguttaceae bacterium]
MQEHSISIKKPIQVCIHGAAGRMGRRLVALAAEDPQLHIVAALEAPDHPQLGTDAGRVAGLEPIGVVLSSELGSAKPDVMIDFSVPEAASRVIQTCLDQQIALVFATTGLTPEQTARLREAAQHIPVLQAPNMSLSVNLAMKLVELAAQALKDHDADVEIIERHHRFKEDSPSGTALAFGRLIAEQMGQNRHVHGRQGRPGRRGHEEIGYHAVRVGDDPGQHTIVFGMLGELLEITVRATSRDCYARGALAAAKFLAGKPPGWYSMREILGL